MDKVYQRKNLAMAWEQVRANRGSGGVDGENLDSFAAQLDQQLDRLQSELRQDTYRPQPVKQVPIPKPGKPGEFRQLGIPTIYDRVCQQALLNRLAPIFEPMFDDANFGYRPRRSTKDALRKVWREIQSGRSWIVDADLKDFFGSVDHQKLLTLVSQQVSDGRVLRLIRAMLEAGSCCEGQFSRTERGTPQGGVISPLLSNILLTPFDREMRAQGYQLTRYADDWVLTCESEEEAQAAVMTAERILAQLVCNCIRRRRGLCTSIAASSFWVTRSSKGDHALQCVAASWVEVVRREPCMPTRASQLIDSKIKSVSELSGGFLHLLNRSLRS